MTKVNIFNSFLIVNSSTKVELKDILILYELYVKNY